MKELIAQVHIFPQQAHMGPESTFYGVFEIYNHNKLILKAHQRVFLKYRVIQQNLNLVNIWAERNLGAGEREVYFSATLIPAPYKYISLHSNFSASKMGK